VITIIDSTASPGRSQPRTHSRVRRRALTVERHDVASCTVGRPAASSPTGADRLNGIKPTQEGAAQLERSTRARPGHSLAGPRTPRALVAAAPTAWPGLL